MIVISKWAKLFPVNWEMRNPLISSVWKSWYFSFVLIFLVYFNNVQKSLKNQKIFTRLKNKANMAWFSVSFSNLPMVCQKNNNTISVICTWLLFNWVLQQGQTRLNVDNLVVLNSLPIHFSSLKTECSYWILKLKYVRYFLAFRTLPRKK